MADVITLNPVGVIRSEHQCAADTPIQPVFAAECEGRVEVFSRFEESLRDIEGLSYIGLYSSRFDNFPDAVCGWQEKIDQETALRRGRRGYRGTSGKGNPS